MAPPQAYPEVHLSAPYCTSCIPWPPCPLPQLRELERGCDFLVATPGRLIDIMDRARVSLRWVLLNRGLTGDTWRETVPCQGCSRGHRTGRAPGSAQLHLSRQAGTRASKLQLTCSVSFTPAPAGPLCAPVHHLPAARCASWHWMRPTACWTWALSPRSAGGCPPRPPLRVPGPPPTELAFLEQHETRLMASGLLGPRGQSASSC